MIVGIEIDRRDARRFTSVMSWPICRPQSPRWTSLITRQPLARNNRCRLSPMIEERRWPTCIGLATLGPPKSSTAVLPSPVCGAPRRAIVGQRARARGQRRVGDVEIDEAGTGDLDLGEDRIGLEPRGDLLGEPARIGLGLLGRRQRAVALELRQIGPVRDLHRPQFGGKAFGGKSGTHDRRQFGGKASHGP